MSIRHKARAAVATIVEMLAQSHTFTVDEIARMEIAWLDGYAWGTKESTTAAVRSIRAAVRQDSALASTRAKRDPHG